jgi:hypothetical protein
MSKVAYAFHERNPEMVPDSTTGAPSVLHYILPVRAAAGSGQRDVLVGRPYLHCSRT